MASLPSSSGQLCAACFEERAKAVYWDREPACNAKGSNNAQCLLAVGHDGNHEGNGFDAHGPIYRCWSVDLRVKSARTRRGETYGDG